MCFKGTFSPCSWWPARVCRDVFVAYVFPDTRLQANGNNNKNAPIERKRKTTKITPNETSFFFATRETQRPVSEAPTTPAYTLIVLEMGGCVCVARWFHVVDATRPTKRQQHPSMALI